MKVRVKVRVRARSRGRETGGGKAQAWLALRRMRNEGAATHEAASM